MRESITSLRVLFGIGVVLGLYSLVFYDIPYLESYGPLRVILMGISGILTLIYLYCAVQLTSLLKNKKHFVQGVIIAEAIVSVFLLLVTHSPYEGQGTLTIVIKLAISLYLYININRISSDLTQGLPDTKRSIKDVVRTWLIILSSMVLLVGGLILWAYTRFN